MKPNIYTYLNFRLFLKESYEYQKKSNSKLSHRRVAQLTDTSIGFFLKVIQGKVNVSEKVAVKFAEFLNLSKLEQKHFELLIRYNQTKNDSERQELLYAIIQKQEQFSHQLGENESVFYSDANYTVIREAIALLNESVTLDDLFERCVFQMTRIEFDTYLKSLEEMGLIRIEESACYQTNRKISPGKIDTSLLKSLNEEWMHRAIQAMYQLSKESRHISSVSVSVSEDGWTQIQELLESTRKQIVAIAQNDRGVNQVRQVNFQAYPLVMQEKLVEVESC